MWGWEVKERRRSKEGDFGRFCWLGCTGKGGRRDNEYALVWGENKKQVDGVERVSRRKETFARRLCEIQKGKGELREDRIFMTLHGLRVEVRMG